MKKSLLKYIVILAFTAIPMTFMCKAQITINSSDVPSTVGLQLMYYEGGCENVAFDVESTGANHTWNFSQADTIASMAHLTDVNLDPSTSPFAGTNLLVKWQQEILPGFYYVRRTHLKLTSAYCLYLGYEMLSDPPSDSILFRVDTGLIAYQFPMTYQTSWSSTGTSYQSENGVPEDTVILKHECEIDGWGQVQTPVQTHNCLRLKRLDYEWNDSLGIWDPPDTAYLWLANNIGMVFSVSNYHTSSSTGLKNAFIRYYEQGVSGIEDNDNLIPDEIVLKPIHPNPFNESTQIDFSLPEHMNVKLDVINIMGQQVGILFDGELDAGTHTYYWDARDNAGKSLENGLYYTRLVVNNTTVKTGKVILIR